MIFLPSARSILSCASDSPQTWQTCQEAAAPSADDAALIIWRRRYHDILQSTSLVPPTRLHIEILSSYGQGVVILNEKSSRILPEHQLISRKWVRCRLPVEEEVALEEGPRS